MKQKSSNIRKNDFIIILFLNCRCTYHGTTSELERSGERGRKSNIIYNTRHNSQYINLECHSDYVLFMFDHRRLGHRQHRR